MEDVSTLVRRARDGDAGAFEDLVSSRKEKAIQLAYRIVGDWEDARDVAQAAFVRLWREIRGYDERYPFDAWFRRIVTNLAIDHYRHGRARNQAIARAERSAGLPTQRPTASASLPTTQAEIARLFDEAARQLPAQRRAVFVMREVDGLAPRDIAAELGISESTVRNHLFKARQALMAYFTARYPEYGPRGGRQ